MWWFSSPGNTFRRGKFQDWFDCLDHNRGGYLNPDDLSRYAAFVRRHLDWTGDDPRLGVLEEACRTFWMHLRARLDDDKDGVVQMAEWVGAFDSLADEVCKTKLVPDWAMAYLRALFDVLDLDGDGGISLEEYGLYLQAVGSDAPPAAAFATLDLDGNGQIDLAELESLFADWLCATEAGAPGNLLMTGRLPRL